MSRTILSYTPEGLASRLAQMQQDIRDLKRVGSGRPGGDEYEPLGGVAGVTRNSAQLLAMTATADPIASGGDYVAFDGLAAKYGFASTGAASGSWVHPVGGVYVLTYHHEWDTYTGGGLVQVVVDGVAVPAGVLFDGTDGQQGFGFVAYAASEGTTGQILVTQTSGSSQDCDASITIALSDPDASAAAGVVSLGTQAAPDAGWTGMPAGWTDSSAHWIWHTALSGDSRPDGEEGWFVGQLTLAADTAVTVEASVDNAATLYINGASQGAVTEYDDGHWTVSLTLPAGTSTFAAYAVNGVAGGGQPNPAGFIMSVRDDVTSDVLFRTTDAGGWSSYLAEPSGWPNP